jgi:phosphatidylinositol alpha-1,6-mannosyltransferase
VRILLLSSVEHQSGSALRFRGIAGALVRRGHDVHLFEPFVPGSRPETPAGVTRLPCPKLNGPAEWQVPLWVGHAVAAVHRVRPEVAYVLKPMPNTWPAAVAAREMGARIALDVDDLEHGYDRPQWARELLRRLFDMAVRSADDVTCHTEPLRHLIDERRSGSSSAVFVEQAVDVERFALAQAGDLRARFRLGEGPLLLYAGHLGIASDLGDLLPALSVVARARPAARLVVVGDGTARASLEARAAALLPKGFVVFVGALPHASVPPFFAAADASLNFLSGEREANRYRASIKVRESLAAGLPTITTRTPDTERFAEFVRFPSVSSAESFVEAVEQELAEPDRERAENGSAWLREYGTFDRAIDELASRWERGS